MAGAVKLEVQRDVACPFCGLVCDDLAIETGPAGPKVRANGCPLSRAGFERRPGAAQARIDGREADAGAALDRAAAILAASRLPLFAGLGTDVDGMRATVHLAERTGGVLDHLGSEGLLRNLRVVQDSGWMTTTLSEVRNRADFLLLVGPDPLALYPRFLERCAGPEPGLFDAAGLEREIVRLGPRAAAGGGEATGEVLTCPAAALPAAVAALRALVEGRRVAATEAGGLPVADLERLAGRLAAARYGVVAWMAATLEEPGAALVVQGMVDLIKALNRVTRCSGLPLTGNDNLLGVNQVCTWQSGVPLRCGFGAGAPEHDPYRYDARRLLRAGEADALVWISAFRGEPPPSSEGVPTVALTAPETRFATPPEVYIPVGTPGVDHGGAVFRTDGVVAVPLRRLRDDGPPSVASVLEGIARRLARAEAAPC